MNVKTISKLSDKELVEIEESIKSLEYSLQTMEDTDFAYMGKPVKRLRHLTFYVHQKVEEFIGKVQSIDLIMTQSQLLNQADATKIYRGMEEIFYATDFGRLLKVAEAKKLLPKGFQGIAGRINEVRLVFAHPRSNFEKLQQFRNPLERVRIYKDLKKAMDMINKHVTEKQKEADALVNEKVNKTMRRVVERIKTEGLKDSEKILREEMNR